MDCYVYVIGTHAGTRRLTYVGWTDNVTRRLAAHNAGKGARSTRGHMGAALFGTLRKQAPRDESRMAPQA
jgi:predicted GIY-YIG superfamily endonuclease